MEYIPIHGRSFAPVQALSQSQGEEQKRWKAMKVLDSRENRGRVVSIAYNPSTDQECVVTWTNQIEKLRTGDAKETLFRTSSSYNYNSARYRSDGELVVYAVGDRGKVVVSDNQGKHLREFAHHSGSVLDARFTHDKVHIASWGSDRQIVVTKLATQEAIFRAREAHEDTIFAGDVCYDNDNLLASGCGKGIVKIWDIRCEKSVAMIRSICSVSRGISSLRLVPRSFTKLVCGGISGSLQSFDLRITAHQDSVEPLASKNAHSKAVSDMCFYGNNTNVVTVGLDGKLCVSGISDLVALYSHHEACSGITSVDSTSKGEEIAIGFENGAFTRKISANFSSVSGTLDQGIKSHWSRPTKVAEKPRHPSLSASNLNFKDFSFKKALIASLDIHETTEESHEKSDQLFVLLEELFHANTIRIALAGWDESQVSRLLVYLVTHMRHRHRFNLIVHTLEVVNEIYSEELVKSSTVRKIFAGLKKDLQFQLVNIRKCSSLSSMLDCFL
mmetsp:Transcript_26856/g.41858  ORF Transcript_26856/g.41858 Transcript_26856/m.41858 type:complete len:501 (-) Transcript_26856:87-1589(-)